MNPINPMPLTTKQPRKRILCATGAMLHARGAMQKGMPQAQDYAQRRENSRRHEERQNAAVCATAVGSPGPPGNSQKKVFNRMKCKVENSNTLKTRAKAACWRKAAELHTLVDTASQYDDKKELFLLIAFCSGRLPRSQLRLSPSS